MIATTRAALFHGNGTPDEYGDETDDNSAEAIPFETIAVDGVETPRPFDNFPASIIERSRQEFDEASGAWRTVRYYVGRVPARVPVVAGDRIRDNRSGAFYVVDEIESMARGISGRSSVTLKMKRTSP